MSKDTSQVSVWCVCVCVCVCVRACVVFCVYLLPMFVHTHPCEQNHKSKMKSVLNFRTGKLCSKVISFRWSEIWVWQLFSEGIVYPFKLEREHIPRYANESEEQL